MKSLKRLTRLLLAGAAVLALGACSSSSSNAETSTTDEADKSAETTSDAAETETNPDDRTTFTVGFDAEFPPYGFKDGDTYTGFDLDLAQAVCDYYGWELVAQPVDWDSKDMELNSGTIDCIWNGFTINGREDNYTWSTPYIDNSQVVVVKADSGINSIDDLAGKVMDVQADSSALAALTGEDATEVGQKINDELGQLIQVSNYNTAFMDLEAGAVDAIAMDVGVANYELSNRDAEFKILDEEISTEQYGIGFKKGNEALRDQVEDALKELDANGKLQEVITKWSEMDDGAYNFLETTWCYGEAE